MKKPLRSLVDYFFLVLISSAAVISALIFGANHYALSLLTVAFSLLYIVWGIIHHTREHTFKLEILLEYTLFALLGCIIVIGLLK